MTMIRRYGDEDEVAISIVSRLTRERDEARAALAAAREEALEEAATAAERAACKHDGDDDYSQGMDRGAREQVEACASAIRAMKGAPKDAPMKIRIVDANALRKVSPAALAAFAERNGWTKTDAFGQIADVYTLDDRPEVVIPRSDHVADYASVVYRLIEIFAAVTGDDEGAVYRAMKGTPR